MDTKLVVVLREGLAVGSAVNAAVVLSLSLAGQVEAFMGAEGADASGQVHPGLNTHPVPVVTASAETLRELRVRAQQQPEVTTIAFSEVARQSREYGEYLSRLAGTAADDLVYVGLVLFGPRGPVTRLTRRLPLLP